MRGGSYRSRLMALRSLPWTATASSSACSAAVRLWGLPYEAWSLILFMLFSVLALRMLLRRAA